RIYSHQVLDHVSLFQPVTKWSQCLTVDNVAYSLQKALGLVKAYPYGPVHLDIPSDVAMAAMPDGDNRIATVHSAPDPWDSDSVDEILNILKTSHNPIAVLGLDAATPETANLLTRVVEAYALPVFTTYKAKGVLDESHPLNLGPIGLSPRYDKIAVDYLRNADVVLTLGLDPVELRSEWLTVWPSLPVMDIGPIPGRFPTRRSASALVSAFLNRMLQEKVDPYDVSSQVAEIREQHRAIIQSADGLIPSHTTGCLAPHSVLKVVDEECHSAVITIDTGAMRIAANHLVHASQPNFILQSNGLGTMGYALPAAIGAQFADADQPVVALTGDAGLLMLLGELSVAAAHSLPIIVVVFVDASLALISLKQSRMHYHHVGVDVTVPDFAGVAEQFGGEGYHVHSLEEFRAQLHETIGRRKGLTVIHVPIDPASYQALM
ncbi:MAG: thiamine pyrophosphate-dependent enzyme, partial [Firmicutes bacterium]|nr:thiamine pyrophosphate-dependent enzyme [Bacillota bacterium]